MYTKKRSEFGRQANFSDKGAEITFDVPPDDSLLEHYVEKNPCDLGIQCAGDMSEHEVNNMLPAYMYAWCHYNRSILRGMKQRTGA